jgi:hypothetical protein
LGAFFAAVPQKTGLSASIFWLRQKDFRSNPLRRAAAAQNRFAILRPAPLAHLGFFQFLNRLLKPVQYFENPWAR